MSNLIIALIGAMVATIAAIASALVFVIRSSKDAGRRESKIDEGIASLAEIKGKLKLVDDHETSIKVLQETFRSHRSDFKELKNIVRPGSRPDWNDE